MKVFRGCLCVPYMLNLMVNISFIYVKSSQLRKWDLLSWCILWGYKREYTGFTTIECIQINLVTFLLYVITRILCTKLLNVKLSNIILDGQVKYDTPYWCIASRLLRVQLVRNVQIFEFSFPFGLKTFRWWKQTTTVFVHWKISFWAGCNADFSGAMSQKITNYVRFFVSKDEKEKMFLLSHNLNFMFRTSHHCSVFGFEIWKSFYRIYRCL